MRIFGIALLFIFSWNAMAQNLTFGFDASPGITLVKVKDKDARSSAEFYPADGFTSVEKNSKAAGIKISIQKQIKDPISVKSGIWLTNKNIYLRNTDGSYSGVSKYKLSYIQVPILFNYAVASSIEKLNFSADLGLVLELKAAESLSGPDGAHFWNLAKNYTHLDPTRGINGRHKALPLFSSSDLSLYLGIAADYQLQEDYNVFLGVSFLQGTANLFNPDILFKEPYNTTSLTEYITAKAAVIYVDLGIRIKLK